MTREPSTSWSSPSPWPIYAPLSWPSPALSHPKETAAPWDHITPNKKKHHQPGETPLGPLGQQWGETPLGWQHQDFSSAFFPSFLGGWRSPLGAHEWTRGHHPSALRDDIFCTKNPFVSMFYIYIAHFQTLMWQLSPPGWDPWESPQALQHKDLCLFSRQATQGLEAKPALKCLRDRNCKISCVCQMFPYCME